MYIACLCPNLVSVHFYAIPILHFKFPKFFIYLLLLVLVVFYNRVESIDANCYIVNLHAWYKDSYYKILRDYRDSE